MCFLLSFFVWLLMWGNFIACKKPLQGDAVSYYEHIGFFVDSVERGVYPLWDAFWNCGVPNSFFLRRMGEFNPFFFLIVLFNKIGLPFCSSYLMFLSLYFFLGMLGFFLLSKVVFNDSFLAFCAYLLLMFSSFPSILFQSFIILIFVPMVWFFYFLLDFFSYNKINNSRFIRYMRRDFVGMVFCLMVTLTTYLPFYFFTVFLSFLFFVGLMYPARLKSAVLTLIGFTRQNRFLVCLGVVAILLSFIPGLNFFMEAGSSYLVLPERHSLSEAVNIMEVHRQSMVMGGIPLKNVFSGLFSNLDKARLGRFFLPLFTYILFAFSCIVKISKRSVFLSLFMFWFLLIGIYDASVVYPFLYKYVFFFRYFRNFQFFLWLVILPVFIWICIEQFALFLRYFETLKQSPGKLRWLLFVVVIIHFCFLVFLCFQKAVVWSSFLSLFLSLLLFLFIFNGRIMPYTLLFLFFIFVVVVSNSAEVIYYINKNASSGRNPNEYWQTHFLFCRNSKMGCRPDGINRDYCPHRRIESPSLYYATRFFSILRSKLDYCLFQQYVNYRFIVYDNVEFVYDSFFDFKRWEKVISTNTNLVFVSGQNRLEMPANGKRKDVTESPLFVSGNSREFEVLEYAPNKVKIRTIFTKRRFLVYNDSYYKGWQALVNGKRVDILRANFAFKGVWIPAGENVVEFCFGSGWQYSLGYFFMAFFAVVLVYLFILHYLTLLNSEKCTNQQG